MASQVIASNQSSPLESSIRRVSNSKVSDYVFGMGDIEPLNCPLYAKTSPATSWTFSTKQLVFDLPKFGHLRAPGAMFVTMDLKLGYDATNTLEFSYGGMQSLFDNAVITTASGREIARLNSQNTWHYIADLPAHQRDSVHQLTGFFMPKEVTNPASGDEDIWGLRASSGTAGGTVKGMCIYLPFSAMLRKDTTYDTGFYEGLQLTVNMKVVETDWVLNNARSSGLEISNVKLLTAYSQFSQKMLKSITAKNYSQQVLTMITEENELLATKNLTTEVTGLSDTTSTISTEISIDSNALVTRFIITAEYFNGGICKGLCEIVRAKLTCAGQEILPDINPKVIALMNGHGSTISGDSDTTYLRDSCYVIPFTQSKRGNYQGGLSLRSLPSCTLTLEIKPISVDAGDSIKVNVNCDRCRSFSVASSSGRISSSLSV